MLFNGLSVRPRFDEYDPIDDVTIVAMSITSTTTYTVPEGKTFLLKGYKASTNYFFLVNGVQVLPHFMTMTDRFKLYYYDGALATNAEAASSSVVYLDTNFILPIKSGSVISCNQSTGAGLGIYGWLIDE